jgi:TRAP-type C4-dicarboxylate transport system substrate-binding protein
MSKKTWDSLNNKQKSAIEKAAAELQEYEINLTTEVVKNAMKSLEGKGMIINQANVAAFAEAVKPVYKSYSDKYGSKDIESILGTK